MTEQKKPFPANKHETRLTEESRPAGIAPSTYREEAGGSVDMVSIVGEKPQVVRVSQRAYDGMVKDGTEVLRNDHFISVFNDPPVAPNVIGPWHVIGTVVVPPGMVFDLSDLRFEMPVGLDGAGVTGLFMLVSDWGAMSAYTFRMCVQGVLPWDAYTVVAGVRYGSMFKLNEPWLSDAGDVPIHIVAAEGQTMTFEVAQVMAGNPTLVFPGGGIFARPRGRWIPLQHYKRITGANSLE